MRRGIIFVCALLVGGMLSAKVKLPALWGDGVAATGNCQALWYNCS